MAGDWIKMRVDLRDDPAVFRIAEAIGVDELHVVGCLFCFWSWADKHAVDGRVDGATPRLVDRVSMASGFADAMVAVGWLVFDESGLQIPNFERHNGESAKERGLKNARQARWRAKKDALVDDRSDASASTTASTTASTREEKRREDTSSLRSEVEAPRKRSAKTEKPMASVNDLVAFGFTPEVAAEFIAYKAEVKAPLTQRAWQDHLAESRKASMSPVQAAEKVMARSWKGFEAKYVANDRALAPAQRNEHKHSAAAKAIFDGVFDD